MAAYRFSRIELTGSSYISFGEVQFLSASGVDLSVGGVASASSSYGSGYLPEFAFDKSYSTQWASAYVGVDPNRYLQYDHGSPVEVARIRVHNIYASEVPTSLTFRGSNDGADWTTIPTVSSAGWPMPAYTDVDFTVIGNVELALLEGVFAIEGRPAEPFSGMVRVDQLHATHDMRNVRPATASITDRVMFKATPSSPETPFAGGRVWLLRLADGHKAWEGWSNAAGYYTATGLELGVDYIAVGIDPNRNHKATGAGPVRAVEAA